MPTLDQSINDRVDVDWEGTGASPRHIFSSVQWGQAKVHERWEYKGIYTGRVDSRARLLKAEVISVESVS